MVTRYGNNLDQVADFQWRVQRGVFAEWDENACAFCRFHDHELAGQHQYFAVRLRGRLGCA
ncbi:MAG: hypothetical protein ACREJN_02125 [Nitrospiraceae bacterium]